MDDLKKKLQKLDLDEFKASDVTPVENVGPHDTVQAQFFGGGFGGFGGGFRCFNCFRCSQCFQCFRCFRCFQCFRCSQCFRCF